jgi:acetylornithine deacetylase/succinyl-diaminopimelate desuccinylase-like protein
MTSPALPELIERRWTEAIVPALHDYIRIPNKSPHFDPQWQAHGFMEEAIARFLAWAQRCAIAGLAAEVVRLPGRTPLLFIEIPGAGDRTVLLYGHLDKQPEMSGWRDGLGPWQPQLRGERLYGRGGADDGYAMFAALTAIEWLQAEQRPHARCVVIIEACEESGSYDLPHYAAHLRDRIGAPDLVVCLDSGCGDYERLWCTTSLRGLVGGELRVAILDEGVHSGDAGGIVPSSFRVLRSLLSRIEDEASGELLDPGCHVEIPLARRRQAEQAAAVLGEAVFRRFPFGSGVGPVSRDPVALILNRTWRPALEVTGASGLPPLADAGNVLRPQTSVALSLRLPPTCDAARAAAGLKRLVESDPPYAAAVRYEANWCADGWQAPPLAPWLEASLDRASMAAFGRPAVYMGEGGTIPFMAMLGREYPRAQFVVTGVLGPQANAHGPNEFLHLPTAKKLTRAIAAVIADHHLASV